MENLIKKDTTHDLLFLIDDSDDDEISAQSEDTDTETILINFAYKYFIGSQYSFPKKAREKKTPVKVNKAFSSNLFADNIVENHLSQYSDQEFKIRLSIHKKIIIFLSEEFSKSSNYLKIIDQGKISLSAKSHLHIFLWFLSHQRISYRNVSKHFRIAISTVQNILFRVATFLNDSLYEVIKWPTNEERILSAEKFCNVTQINGIFGIIGNTYIETDNPEQKGEIMRIPVQAICNHEMKFIDVFVGDAIHKDDLFVNSNIIEKLESLNDNQFLVGKIEYSTIPYIKIPLKSKFELSNDQINYNEKIEFCLNQLQICFQRMKNQFKQLDSLKIRNKKLQILIIKACFILYNMNLKYEENFVLNDHNYISEQNFDATELIIKPETCK